MSARASVNMKAKGSPGLEARVPHVHESIHEHEYTHTCMQARPDVDMRILWPDICRDEVLSFRHACIHTCDMYTCKAFTGTRHTST